LHPKTILCPMLVGVLTLVSGCVAKSDLPIPASSTPTPSSARAVAAPSAQQGGPCSASELKLTFDGRDGEFTGMSHDGSVLILRNTGSRSCTVPKRPQLTFTDVAGKPVFLTVRVPLGMHPGPVLVPVALAPGAAAQGTMRWVMGDVYDGHNCVAPAHALLAVEGGALTQDFRANVCGPAGKPPTYEQEFLQPAGAATSADAAH
jgi:hypothetical protein